MLCNFVTVQRFRVQGSTVGDQVQPEPLIHKLWGKPKKIELHTDVESMQLETVLPGLVTTAGHR
jgi:hypothetical protein